MSIGRSKGQVSDRCYEQPRHMRVVHEQDVESSWNEAERERSSIGMLEYLLNRASKHMLIVKSQRSLDRLHALHALSEVAADVSMAMGYVRDLQLPVFSCSDSQEGHCEP